MCLIPLGLTEAGSAVERVFIKNYWFEKNSIDNVKHRNERYSENS